MTSLGAFYQSKLGLYTMTPLGARGPSDAIAGILIGGVRNTGWEGNDGSNASLWFFNEDMSLSHAIDIMGDLGETYTWPTKPKTWGGGGVFLVQTERVNVTTGVNNFHRITITPSGYTLDWSTGTDTNGWSTHTEDRMIRTVSDRVFIHAHSSALGGIDFYHAKYRSSGADVYDEFGPPNEDIALFHPNFSDGSFADSGSPWLPRTEVVVGHYENGIYQFEWSTADNGDSLGVTYVFIDKSDNLYVHSTVSGLSGYYVSKYSRSGTLLWRTGPIAAASGGLNAEYAGMAVNASGTKLAVVGGAVENWPGSPGGGLISRRGMFILDVDDGSILATASPISRRCLWLADDRLVTSGPRQIKADLVESWPVGVAANANVFVYDAGHNPAGTFDTGSGEALVATQYQDNG